MFSKDVDEVADLFQEILINMWKGIQSFRGDSSISTWVWRVSLNICINTSKKRTRLETIPLNVNINPYEDVDDEALQVRQLYERVNRLGLIDRSMSNLSLSGKNSNRCLTTLKSKTMEDNRLEMSRELEDMCRQFAIMKERFDRQEIVTDRLVRETQRRRINLYDWLTLYGPTMIAVAMLPLVFMCCRTYGMPVWLAVTAYVMIVASIIWHSRERKKYRRTFRFDDDVSKIVRGVRDFRIRTYKMTIVATVIAVIVVATGLWAWLPNVQLTDDPLRWALAAVLWLVVIVTVVYVEVKSFRILDSIAKDLEY